MSEQATPKKDHEHNYVAEKYTVQVEYSTYLSAGECATGIKEVQHILIFCTKCGADKKITEVK